MNNIENTENTKKQLSPQPSESIVLGAFLAVAGGFMDAYTYTLRGSVFANAVTGNVVLLGINIANCRYQVALTYLIPLVSFVCGVLISNSIRHRFQNIKIVHWRQLVLALEFLLLFSVGFMPHSLDALANAVISMRCAIQICAFKKILGNACATTMCTGNIRSGTEWLFKALTDRQNPAHIKKTAVYYSITMFFTMGAMSGVIFSDMLGLKAIWICCLLLVMPSIIMFCKQ